ncbi:BioY family protein [Aeromicrobium marinum DSM 15272]|uniref:Biotin transporter n=1 Tax=Aeromicrobium marinum DSM 15272 TaxID=585531 RepID=E2SFF3_9ACTN|nr:biotin transporter BioY [Aeromicrobium marinum]EFQ82054.1 BioY family protein [Aeromicrobium marinum DSM 15272]
MTTPGPTAAPTRRRSPSTDLALVTTFAAVIGVCAVLPAINGVANVPFTLQMFGVFLAGAVLGAKRGFVAVALYLAVATAGVPIFAQGQAGPGVWGGATGGYLLAFPIAAFLVGVVASAMVRRGPTPFTVAVSVAAAVATVAVVGTLGTLGMARALDVPLGVAWGYATPFFLADIAKGVIAAIVAAAVHRAFPRLTRG